MSEVGLYAWGHMVVLEGGRLLVSEVALYLAALHVALDERPVLAIRHLRSC